MPGRFLPQIVLFVVVFLLCPLAQARNALDFTIHQEYLSTRALGMGNAFTAVVDDHNALFYNPAALARRKDGHLRMFLRAGLDINYVDLVNDIEDAEGGTEDEEIDAIAEVIQKNYGKTFYARVPTIGGIWVRPNWGIALIPADLSIDLAVHQQVGPALNVNAYLDTTLAYGYARNVKWFGKGHKFSLGATLKAIHRVHASEALLAGELAENSDVFDTSDANEGLAIDLDIGTLYTPRVPKKGFFSFLKYMKPSFAVVARNVVDQGFSINFNLIDENSGEPPKLQRRFDFGTKFDLPKFWVFDPKIGADIRDVGHDNWSFKKGYHAGFELFWQVFSWWKGYWSGGINQGYWTAGFGARLGWFQLDLASYGEEVGTKSVPKESRRYMLEMSLDF